MRSNNASPRVRGAHMRQPTGWTVPNPDLGDRHFRDKAPTLHVFKSTDHPQFTAWNLLKSKVDGGTV